MVRGQDDDFVERLQHDLQRHHHQQFPPGDDASEGDGEEDERVRRLARHRRHDGPQREAPPPAGQLHAAHDVGVEERPGEEGQQAGHHDAGRHAEHEVEVLLALPERGGGQGHGCQPQPYDEEVHGKAAPDDEPCLAEAPHFGDAVVDDVGDGEHEQPCRYGEASQLDDFGLEEVCRDEAYVEQYAEQHEWDGYLLFHRSCFLRGFLEYTAATGGIIRLFGLQR